MLVVSVRSDPIDDGRSVGCGDENYHEPDGRHPPRQVPRCDQRLGALQHPGVVFAQGVGRLLSPPPAPKKANDGEDNGGDGGGDLKEGLFEKPVVEGEELFLDSAAADSVGDGGRRRLLYQISCGRGDWIVRGKIRGSVEVASSSTRYLLV